MKAKVNFFFYKVFRYKWNDQTAFAPAGFELTNGEDEMTIFSCEIANHAIGQNYYFIFKKYEDAKDEERKLQRKFPEDRFVTKLICIPKDSEMISRKDFAEAKTIYIL